LSSDADEQHTHTIKVDNLAMFPVEQGLLEYHRCVAGATLKKSAMVATHSQLALPSGGSAHAVVIVRSSE
jgi:hypothetical protein